MRNAMRGLVSTVFLATTAVCAVGANAQGQPEPSSDGSPAPNANDEDKSLEEIIVTGEITYRDRVDSIAPALSYGEEFFQKFEPTSVGDSLKRVPGVSFGSDIGEYDSPGLRGLAAGFTQILVNGRPIPGGGNDRTVFVDRIPAEIIDRIEIIRSPSADIDSQGIGGSINIILKSGASLPPGVIARAGVQLYPDGKNVYKGSGALSWSGRSDDERVAYSLTLDAQQRYNPKKTIEEVFSDDSPGFDDTTTGLELFKPFDFDNSVAIERVEESDTRRSFDLSVNGDITFQVGDTGKLSADGFFIRTRRTDTENTFNFERPEDDDGDPDFSEMLDLDSIELAKERFRQENFGTSLQYQFQPSENLTAELRGQYSQFNEKSFVSTFDNEDPEDPELFETSDINSRDREMVFDGSLKFGMPGLASGMGADSASLKIGASTKFKRRNFSLIEFEDIDEDAELASTSGVFRYRENRLDGFAVGEIDFGGDTKFQLGARIESTKTRQRFASFDEDTLEPDTPSTAKSSEFHFNPSAHFQAGVTPGGVFRASVARTVRRPSIDQQVPSSNDDSPEDDDITIGNPDLKFETSWGIDVGYEQKLGRKGILGVNFFHRWVRDLIGLVNTGLPSGNEDDDDEPVGNLYTFANTGKGKIYGIEFDLSTPLSFVGLENTGVFANYTRLWSKRTEPTTGLRVAFNGQPKYVYNFGVTQDFPTIDASAGFSYRKQGNSTSIFFGENEYQRYGGNLEAFVEKRLGKNVVVRLSGNNLIDARSLQYEQNFDGDTGAEVIANQQAGDVDEFEVEREESARQIMLTLRLVF